MSQCETCLRTSTRTTVRTLEAASRRWRLSAAAPVIPVAAARQRASPVREHLELVATAHGAGVQVGVTVEAALAEWELAGCAEAFRSMLSPGQLQKLFLAAVFVRPRELLVLDEPEQRLDLRMRRRLTSRLRRETADGVAVLVATHSRDLAEQVADRVLVLESRAVPRIWVLPVRCWPTWTAKRPAACDLGGARSNRPVVSDADVARHLRQLRGGNRAVLTRSQVLYVAYLLGLVSL